MKKALVIGAAGFVGSYLIHHLHEECHMEVAATKLSREQLGELPAEVYDLDILNKNDIVVLAGKGHEPYQEINGEKLPFDERIIVKECLEEKK